MGTVSRGTERKKRNGGAALLALVLIVFVLARVSVPSPYYLVSMDEAKYLTLARNFPRHTLFNQQLYLVHPPLFPYAIRFLSLALPDHVAGIAVSFIFSLLTFFSAAAIFRLLGSDKFRTALALLVLAVSPLHIPASRVIYKDSMFFGLFALSLYFYLRGMIRREWKSAAAAGVLAAACALTFDLALYLLPCYLFAWVVFRKPGARPALALLAPAIQLVAWLGWLMARWSAFRGAEFYPVGVDGTLEYVGRVTLRQLIAPRYFPATMTMFRFVPDFSSFRLNANVYDLCPLLPLPPALLAVFYLFIGATAIFSVVTAVGKKQSRGNAAVFFSLLFFLFSLPVILHPEPRFLLPILLPLGYLFAHGVGLLCSLTRIRDLCLKTAARTAVLFALLATGIHLLSARHPIFSLEKEVESWRTAEALKGLPPGGVMAQVGYPPELAYLTGRRVVSLPVVPQVLDRFIKEYDIRYLVYGQHYLAPLSTDDPSLIWCYRTIRHIRSNPRKYPLLKVVREDYRARDWPDAVFIHGVSGGE